MNPFATFSAIDAKPNKQFSLEKPKKKTAVVFYFVAAVQEHDNFKTLLKCKEGFSWRQVVCVVDELFSKCCISFDQGGGVGG